MIELKITARPSLRNVEQFLRDIPKGLRDFRPTWQKTAAEVFRPAIQRAFKSKSSPGGEAWTPLTQRSAKEKRKAGYSPRLMLFRTGTLWRSLTAEGKTRGALRTFKKRFLHFGTRLGYAAPLQFGDHKRPFVAWNRGMETKATTTVVNGIEVMIHRARERRMLRGGA